MIHTQITVNHSRFIHSPLALLTLVGSLARAAARTQLLCVALSEAPSEKRPKAVLPHTRGQPGARLWLCAPGVESSIKTKRGRGTVKYGLSALR